MASVVAWGSTFSPVSTVKPKTKGKKAAGTQVIVNPIFAQCAQMTDDPYWIAIFNNAAIGKMPSKFLYRSDYNGSFVTFKQKSKVFSCQIMDNIFLTFTSLTNFFRTHGGLISPADREKFAQEEMAASEVMRAKVITWAVCSRKARKSLLEAFIAKTKALYGLSARETLQLQDFLSYNINTVKTFDKHYIKLSSTGQSIETIDGLLWNSSTRRFYTDVPQPRAKPIHFECSPHPTAGTCIIGKIKKRRVSYTDHFINFLVGITRHEESKEESRVVIVGADETPRLHPDRHVSATDGDDDTGSSSISLEHSKTSTFGAGIFRPR